MPEYFYEQWFDEEENVEITYEYKITNNRFYCRMHKGKESFKWKRVSGKTYASAYESVMNY